jgi:bifunctional non-homologous end joining protein LigD
MSYFDQPIRPMEPRLSSNLPGGEMFSYQVKWDGMRLLAFASKGKLRLQGKSLRDKTAKYPELAVLPQLFNGEEFILDGELIALIQGRPCFYSLMRREQRSAFVTKNYSIPVFYMVFDCLFHDGAWLGKHAWEARQEILAGALREDGIVRICTSFADGENLWDAVKKQRLEGIVAKQRESPYITGPRKSPYWLKIKLEQQIEARVGGLLLRDRQVTSLLLGLEENGEQGNNKPGLRYIGNVSSGLTQQDLADWQKWGRRHELSQHPFLPPFSAPGKEIIWVEPCCSINVTYNEWTPELKLRAPRITK